MITLIVFGILFLVGFALLIALLGTSFLKRHAVRLSNRVRNNMHQRGSRPAASRTQPASQDFGGGYQAPVPQSEPVSAPPMPQLPPRRYGAGASSAGSKWAYIPVFDHIHTADAVLPA